MKKQTYNERVKLALEYYEKASIVLTEEEKARIEEELLELYELVM